MKLCLLCNKEIPIEHIWPLCEKCLSETKKEIDNV